MPSPASGVRSLPCQIWYADRAAPRAPPASPAAGWIQTSSKMPRRSSLPLATQLRATPPAITSLLQPVSSRAGLRQLEDHLFGDLLDGQGQIHVFLGDVTLGPAGRDAEQGLPPVVHAHGQPGGKVKILHVEQQGAVLADVNQLVVDGLFPAFQTVPRSGCRTGPGP